MSLVTYLPKIDLKARWAEVLLMSELQNLPFKVELNEWGHIMMSPASNKHGYLQTLLAAFLHGQKKEGGVITECSVLTRKGVKVADVVWFSAAFLDEQGLATPFGRAPELCIEIISPSNTMGEMTEKIDLYLAKGAREVWLCDEEGVLKFYSYEGALGSSQLFPEAETELDLGLGGG
ncbi:MAG TPA: Uma2 family endonuclease [Anaerolineae bacterium]|nr:Uma2 family endonuclease [Anaerolineae bacterium]